MIEDYAVAALYLVPVAAAAVVAYLVTRKPTDEPQIRQYELPKTPPRPIPTQRDSWEDRYDRYVTELSERRVRHAATGGHARRQADKPSAATDGRPPIPRAPNVTSPTASQSPFMNAPTLMNAALSAHLSTVSRQARGRRTPIEAHQIPNLASIRRPTRLDRRAAHRCARKNTI